MHPLVFNLTLVEIIILQIGGVILGIAIYFFWTSNKALSETIRQSKTKLQIAPKRSFLERVGLGNTTLEELEQKISRLKNKPVPEAVKKPQVIHQSPEVLDNHTVGALKEALLRQQQTLNLLIDKIGIIEGNNTRNDLIEENEELQNKIEKLELKLESKDDEIKKIKQQEAVTQQMAGRIEEVYKEFDVLQQKMASLEKQAGRANALALELEDAKQFSAQLQKDLQRKHEKLEEMIAESQRLHTTLSTTEDKLAEANMQRQQLQKKVQFLQDVNNDMQHVSESNQKLQNELRRIGELESMLSMIAEERDRLLNKGEKE